MKYYTKTTNVDVETGEELPLHVVKRKYIIIKTTKKYTQDGKYIRNEITRECKRNTQLEIEW